MCAAAYGSPHAALAPSRARTRAILSALPSPLAAHDAHAVPRPNPSFLRHTIEAHLGIKAGETSADGLFTLTEVECLGACVNAPMIQVNDFFFENLTPENTITLLGNLRDGKKVLIGPQNGLVNSEGPMGRTSLTGPPRGPYCRDLEATAPA